MGKMQRKGAGGAAARLWGGAALAALLAGPALAQDFCGGASAGGQWIGGTEPASDVATAPAPMEQLALVLMDNTYTALFSLSAPAEVRLEAQGRGSGDPVIELLDEAGAVVASDDDSGGNSASRSEVALEPGRYCLSVTSYDGSPMTGTVRVARTEQEALTAGLGGPADPAPTDPLPTDPLPVDPFADPLAQGGGVCDGTTPTLDLGGGQSIDAILAEGVATSTGSVEETPYVSFTLDAAAAVSITAENVDADPVITLYDATGSYLAENDDYDGLNSRLDMTPPLQPGRYCVAVTALSDPTLPITLTVAAYDAQAAQVGMYDRAEASPPLDGSYPVTALGPLANRVRQDVQSTDVASWFSFEVTEGGLILVEAVTNGMGDPTLTLFDDFGRQVAFNDDHDGTLDSLVTARVMPGTYLVAVKQLGTGTQALTRLLFERYVPAP